MQNRSTSDTENESDDKVEKSSDKINLNGDYGNIALLLLLYVLQGDNKEILSTNQLGD